MRNPYIRGFPGVREVLTLGFWDVVNPVEAKQIGFYRPLVTVLFTAGWALSGPEPWGYHLVSLLAHAAATILVLALARRLAANAVAFAAALLFALHPIHTESVTWISGISDVSCAVFFFAALLVFLDEGAGARALASRVATGLFALLALLGKEMGLALLPAALALDLARGRLRRATWGASFGRALPLLLAIAAYLALRVHAFGEVRAGLLRAPTYLGLEGPEAWRAWTLPFELFAGHLRNLLFPFEPNTCRVLRFDLAPTDPRILGSLVACVAFLAFLAGPARRLGVGVRAGAAFLAVSSLPIVVRPETLGQFPLSDRFAYIPSFGFCLAVAAGAGLALERIAGPRRRRELGGGILAAIAAVYAVAVHVRNPDYRDDRSLFEAARAREPNSATVRWCLARAYAEAAQRETDSQRRAALWEAARVEVEASLAIDPRRFHVVRNDRTQANLLRGWIEVAEGSLATAEAIFRLVVELDPRSPEARLALGNVLEMKGDLDAADRDYVEALELHPRYARAFYSRGSVAQARDDLPAAAEAFRKALEADPGHFDAAARLGQVLYHLGNRSGAAAAWEHALRADPEHPNAPIVRDSLAAVRAGR